MSVNLSKNLFLKNIDYVTFLTAIVFRTKFFLLNLYASISWRFKANVNVNKIMYNRGQKVGDKFVKLSKIGFSMECFTADFLQFFTKKHQNLALGWTAGYSPSNLSISEIFLKFPNFLRSLCRKWFGNLWGNTYTRFLVIII